MRLLTQQRIISNGLAQLQFTEVWPSIRGSRPHRVACCGASPAPSSPSCARSSRSSPSSRGARSWSSASGGACCSSPHWAVADLLARAGLRAAFFTGAEIPAAAHPEHRRLPRRRTRCACSSPPTPAASASTCSAPPRCCINLELPWNPAVLEQRIGRIYRLGQTRPDRRLQPRELRQHRGPHPPHGRRQEGAVRRALRRQQRRGPLRRGHQLPCNRARDHGARNHASLRHRRRFRRHRDPPGAGPRGPRRGSRVPPPPPR